MPSNANYEVPNLDESIVDGIAINPEGVLSGQTLVYDPVTNSFIPGSSSGNVNGIFSVTSDAYQIPFAVGTSSLQGDSNFVWNNTDGYLGINTGAPSYPLHLVGDGYLTSRLIINASSASVSSSGTGALRFNTGTNHLEFSENGGSWQTFASGIAIGGTVTGGTSGSILYVDGSTHLAQDNSNFFWDSSTRRLGIGTSSPDAKLHVLQPALTSGSPIIAHFVGGNHTGLPAGTEVLDVYSNLARTIQLTGGSYATQRAFLITAPTYGFTTPSTITTAATFAVQNAPVGGTGATITNAYSIWAQAGIAAFDGHIKVDGYLVDLSAGASTGQVLSYNGTKFLAQTNSATQGGTTSATNVPYASSSNTLADTAISWNNATKTATVTTITGNNGYTVTDGTRAIALGVTSSVGQLGTTSNNNLAFYTNNSATQMTLSTGGQLGIGASPSFALHVVGDGYVTSREVIAASSAAVSPSGTGAIRFNTGTSHLEFSENGGSWQQFGSAAGSTITIGNTVSGGTQGSVLFVDSSGNLAQDNANHFWDGTNHRLGIGTSSPLYSLDIRNATDSSVFHIRTGATTDDGFYINAGSSGGTTISVGAKNTGGGTWQARSANAELIDMQSTGIAFYFNTGLTVGNNFSPTQRAIIDNAGFRSGQDNTYTLGASGTRWSTTYTLNISSTSSALNFSAANGSNILTMTTNGNTNGDYLHTFTGTTDNTGLGPIIVKAGTTNSSNNAGTGITLDATTNTGGRKWTLASTGALSGPGAGCFAFFDLTAGAYRWTLDKNGNISHTPGVSTTGSPVGMQYTGAAHTTLSASAESFDGYFKLDRTVQFSSGALPIQRAVYLSAPTYAFNGPSTIAQAATLAIGNAPQAGTNATITNAYSLWTQAGLARFDGHIKVDGYTIDISGGASNTQVLAFNGTSFVPTNANSGSIGGSIAANQVAYGSGTNTIQGSSGLTYNGTTLTVAQHISVDGYTIDLSAGGTNGQALVYNSTSGKVVFQTVSGGGGGSSIGSSGQKFITHIPAGFIGNNGTATPLTVGACSFTPTNYTLAGTTQSAEFRVVAACGNTTVTGHAKLRDITNGVDITTFNITGSSDTTYTQILTISSAGSNSITSGTAIYEVRIYVDNPLIATDFIQLYMAELRNINTIN